MVGRLAGADAGPSPGARRGRGGAAEAIAVGGRRAGTDVVSQAIDGHQPALYAPG